MAWDFVMNFARDNQLQVSRGLPAARAAERRPMRGPAARAPMTKGSQCGPFVAPSRIVDQAAASALTLADRRLLWRAALFLWNRPLSATESITLWAVLKSSAGLGLVAGDHGLLHVLDDGAELRAQRGVGGVELDVLADALAARGDANGLLLGFGGGGHAWSCLGVEQRPRV